MFWSALLSFFLSILASIIIDKVLFLLTGYTSGIVVILLAFITFFFMFTYPIVRYLRTLADGLMSIARGNLHFRIPVTHQDELGEVAKSINYMAEQLQNMIRKERQAEISKMELITNVSHDLRTPLTSLIGYLNLLQNDDTTDLDEHKRYINNAFNKSQQLKKLIDDLFEYTRLTSGNVHLTLQTVDFGELLKQIVNEFEPLATEHSLKVSTNRELRPILGRVDVEKIVRAIDNLLMNALKFSYKPGEIIVRLFERQSHIYFAVINEGKPITKEQESLLFERFYKAEASRNDNHMPPGSGLGLSIAKNIVELHGGVMGLNHQDGHYTFYMELPRGVNS